MKIIFISGILSFSWRHLLDGWKNDLPRAFPDAEIVFIDKPYYCTQFMLIKKFIREARSEIEKTPLEKPILILAHSFGGLVAKKALEGINRPNIQLITLATPHKASIFTYLAGCEWAKRKLQIPMECPCLVKTYGGTRDFVVFNGLTRMGKVLHEALKTGHLGFLLEREVRKKIIEGFRNE